MAIKSRYKLKTGEEVEYFPPIQNTDTPYATEAAMHADQANQLEGYGYLVDGVGAFTYLGTTAGTAADYKAFGGNAIADASIVPFVIKWNATADVAITLPIGANDVGLVKIDWGDGTINYTNIHTYAASGVKTISLFANRMTFYNPSLVMGLTEVVQWGSVKWKFLSFNGAINLTLLPVSEIPDLSETTSLNTTFKNTGLSELPVGIFNKAINVVAATQLCKGSPVNTIPDNLFINSSSLKNLSEAFTDTNISVIPVNIFKGAISITNVSGLFRSAGGITSIPENLFEDCINLEDVSYAFWYQSVTTVPLRLFYYNNKINNFNQAFRNNPIVGRVPELWMRYPNAASEITFQGATGADNYSTIPTAWGGTYEGGYGKMLSAYIWEGSQADFDAQSQAWKDDPNIIHIIDGSVVGLDLRASNLAADLTAAEKDVIKTKLSIVGAYDDTAIQNEVDLNTAKVSNVDQIQSDWNQSSTSSKDFIKNKPKLFGVKRQDLSFSITVDLDNDQASQIHNDLRVVKGSSTLTYNIVTGISDPFMVEYLVKGGTINFTAGSGVTIESTNTSFSQGSNMKLIKEPGTEIFHIVEYSTI